MKPTPLRVAASLVACAAIISTAGIAHAQIPDGRTIEVSPPVVAAGGLLVFSNSDNDAARCPTDGTTYSVLWSIVEAGQDFGAVVGTGAGSHDDEGNWEIFWDVPENVSPGLYEIQVTCGSAYEPASLEIYSDLEGLQIIPLEEEEIIEEIEGLEEELEELEEEVVAAAPTFTG